MFIKYHNIIKFYNNLIICVVLDKTLNGIQMVCDSMTERLFRTPGPTTKYFKRFFCRLINNVYNFDNNFFEIAYKIKNKYLKLKINFSNFLD